MKVLLALAIIAIAYGFYSNYGGEKVVANDVMNLQESEHTVKQSTFLDTQLQAIEKAKNVENVLQDAADRRRVEIDGQ